MSEHNGRAEPRADLRVVAFVGGGAAGAVLPALCQAVEHVTAITSSADDGGSTGRLRREHGIVPVGDMVQAQVAMSHAPDKRMFLERNASKHTYGNLYLAERILARSGDVHQALQDSSDRLSLRHGTRVLPVTDEATTLQISWPGAETVVGEDIIADYDFHGRHRPDISLLPTKARISPQVEAEIGSADVILVSPSNMFCSIAPIMAARGMGEALRDSSAEKVYMSNLVWRPGQTEGLTAVEHGDLVNHFMGGLLLDRVYVNSDIPTGEAAKPYLHAGEGFVEPGHLDGGDFAVTYMPLLAQNIRTPQPGDQLAYLRGLAQHDAQAFVIDMLARRRVLAELAS